MISVPASDDPASVGPVDLIINFVKCYHTEAAVRAAAPMIATDTAVLSLQNGWGNAPRIASIVGEDRVLVGLTYHGGTLARAGPRQASGRRHDLYRRAQRQADRAPRQGRRGRSARPQIETTLSDKILDEVWKKLALNACTLPIAGAAAFHVA